MMEWPMTIEQLEQDAILMAAINFPLTNFKNLNFDIKHCHQFAQTSLKQADAHERSISMLTEMLNDVRQDMMVEFNCLCEAKKPASVSAFIADQKSFVYMTGKLLAQQESKSAQRQKAGDAMAEMTRLYAEQEALLRTTLHDGQTIGITPPTAPQRDDEPLRSQRDNCY